MDPRQRVVTRMPLTELWHDDLDLGDARCCGIIDHEGICTLLRSGLVRFVVADVGRRLEWIPGPACFDFWKREARHITQDVDGIDLTEVDYAFIAKKWLTLLPEPIVVLEKLH